MGSANASTPRRSSHAGHGQGPAAGELGPANARRPPLCPPPPRPGPLTELGVFQSAFPTSISRQRAQRHRRAESRPRPPLPSRRSPHPGPHLRGGLIAPASWPFTQPQPRPRLPDTVSARWTRVRKVSYPDALLHPTQCRGGVAWRGVAWRRGPGMGRSSARHPPRGGCDCGLRRPGSDFRARMKRRR